MDISIINLGEEPLLRVNESVDDKNQINEYKLLCQSCLCAGRTLHKITDPKMARFYLDSLQELPLCNVPTVCPSICWECKASLKKAVGFREQVKDSYRILQTYTNENLREYLLRDVVRTSHLQMHTRSPISIEPVIEDVDETENAGREIMFVKGELKIEQTSNESKQDSMGLDEGPLSDCDARELDADIPVSTNLQEFLLCDVLKSSHGQGRAKCQALDPDFDNVDESGNAGKEVSFGKQKLKTELDSKQDSTGPGGGPLYDCDAQELDADIPTFTNLQEYLLCDVMKSSQGRAKSPASVDPDVEDADKVFSKIRRRAKKESKKESNVDGLSECDSQELDVNLTEHEGKKKKRSRVEKIKRAGKAKRLQNGVKRPKGLPEPRIVTLELSYEEMLSERRRAARRPGYVRAALRCASCLRGFAHKRSYRAHNAAKHDQGLGNYICPICKTIISSVESFTSHYKRHMRRYECSICRKRTMDLKVMQQHYYSTHEIALKQYTCDLCGKISNSIDTHRYHKDTHKARVQCSECDKTFTHRAGLLNHRLSVHELHNAFPCTVCEKVFRWKTSLKRHLEKHDLKDKSSDAAANCDECGISFSSISSYHRHMKNSLKHVTQDQLRFICDDCGRRFADKTKLRDHIEEKHLLRTYQCDICLKPSKNRVALDQHLRNVHKGRPNNKICHHCGKGFPTKVQLESHIRTHTGERPFICEYCPTMFSQQSNLYKHRQVHLDIKTKRYPMCKRRKEDKREEAPPAALPPDAYRPAPLHYSPARALLL